MKTAETNENLPEEKRRATLRERLIAGYLANAEQDALLAEEWRPLEEEVWMKLPHWVLES